MTTLVEQMRDPIQDVRRSVDQEEERLQKKLKWILDRATVNPAHTMSSYGSELFSIAAELEVMMWVKKQLEQNPTMQEFAAWGKRATDNVVREAVTGGRSTSFSSNEMSRLQAAAWLRHEWIFR